MSVRVIEAGFDPVVDSGNRGFVSDGPLAEALETTIECGINCT